MNDKLSKIECMFDNSQFCLQWRCEKYQLLRLIFNLKLKLRFFHYFPLVYETSFLYCERFSLIIVNRKSKFGSFNNNIDLKYLCSNWIAINQFLQEWLVPAIRYEMNFMRDNLKYSLIVRSSKLWCAFLGAKQFPKLRSPKGRK